MTITAETAEQIMWSALREYGLPKWCAYMSIIERQAIPQARRAEILEMARYDASIEKSDDIVYEMMKRWCADNLFVHLTQQTLGDEIGITPERAHRLMMANTDRFRKIQRGLWEVRDPRADRNI